MLRKIRNKTEPAIRKQARGGDKEWRHKKRWNRRGKTGEKRRKRVQAEQERSSATEGVVLYCRQLLEQSQKETGRTRRKEEETDRDNDGKKKRQKQKEEEEESETGEEREQQKEIQR